ncbi:trypsin-like peptidase domain-containing protein [Cellulomonas biazotea]|uniref:trypsin-like peptidase domain-containing protein n=1 Tax=Cellulomonas biazotea TaxID=1709 RepID=UPI00103137DE|nr:trypsin-like peptidase domain-containing protein [Cellulomonas biazotea]
MRSTSRSRRRPGLRRTVLAVAATAAISAGTVLTAPSVGAATSDPADADTGTAHDEAAVVQLYVAWSGFVGFPGESGTVWSDELEIATGCSGFFVSDTGQIATAGHCVDPVEGRHALVDAFFADLVATGVLTTDEAVSLLDTAYMNWPVEGLDAGSEPERIVYAIQPKAVDGIVIEDPLAVQVVDYRAFDEGDVALLKAEVTGATALPVADADPASGTEVTAIGFAGAVQDVTDATRARASFKSGTVSSQQITDEGVPRTEVSADLTAGMSGGPTLDPLGNVVGLISSGTLDGQSFNFITDASDLREWLTAKGVTLLPAQVPQEDPAPVAATAPVAGQRTTAPAPAVLVGGGLVLLLGIGAVTAFAIRARRRSAPAVPPPVTYPVQLPAAPPRVDGGAAAPVARPVAATPGAPWPGGTVLVAPPPVAEPTTVCPTCTAATTPGQKFCTDCGTPL